MTHRRRRRQAAARGHARARSAPSACRASPTASSTCRPGPTTAPRDPRRRRARHRPHARRRRPRRAAERLDPKVRKDIQGIVRDAATALTPKAAQADQRRAGDAQPGGQPAHRARPRADARPGRAAVAADAHGVGGRRAGAPPRRRSAAGIDDTAGVLTAVASEREALADSLERAPESLRVTTRTLRAAAHADPAAARPGPARRAPDRRSRSSDLLRVSSRRSTTRGRCMRSAARADARRRARALAPLPRLERAASPALASTTKALKEALPLIAGLRPYTPELVAGFFTASAARPRTPTTPTATTCASPSRPARARCPALIPLPAGGNARRLRTGLDARCPGAAEEPAPDGSNPWTSGAARAGPATRGTTTSEARRSGIAAPRSPRACVAVAAIVAPASPGDSEYRVDVVFDDARGLVPGQLVQIAGARVGTIEDVSVTRDFKARIHMRRRPRVRARSARTHVHDQAAGPDRGELRRVRPGHAGRAGAEGRAADSRRPCRSSTRRSRSA